MVFGKGKNYKWEVLGLLWMAFLLNQADRQVFNVLLPLIKSDLGLSDVQVGTIATVFNLVYAFLVPFAGYAGDVFSRKWIVTISIVFWSIATMFTGLTSTVFMLIIMRSIATGGGEAFFGPANYTLLAAYHTKTRALAMSIHQTSYYVGIILCGYVAGYLGEHYGWRSAFYLFGGLGVVHGLVMAFRLKDKKPVPKPGEVKEKIKFLEGLRVLFRTPTALILTIGFSGLIFVLVGYLTWTPTYLYERFSMSLTNAGFHSMFYTHLFAFIGILVAGRLSDAVSRKNPANRLLLQALGLLVAAPFILMMGVSSSLPLIYIGFAGFGFGRAFFDANTYAVLYDVIPEKYQSSASGVMMMTGFGVGSLSSILLGYLKPIIGLSMGISSLAIIWVACGILFLVGYKYYYMKDYNRIHNTEVTPD
ncbi:MFS transporter [Flagellimonas taeanensis]|uniref:MFS transporter n=1 Tax=Flavobacteriaceae TaxID=49546 RepID=UPI000E682F84|nr:MULTISPECIES: MFS transporter [Allomuricauda]MDC6386151.1 MFS transporter [Muricauda sp. SK9]RIV50381.1 MFS transporter [Allomuricauda taeanensis]